MKIILSLFVLSLALAAEPITVCQVGDDQKPVQGKCFVVPAPVMASFEAFIANQKTVTVGADGKQVETPKYASVFDLFVKHFIQSLVLPIVELHPTPEVAAAKAAAEAAAKQVDAAKYAALQ